MPIMITAGQIPKELGNLQAVTSLFLPSNKLSGQIPKELGNLQAVTTLSLEGNRLSGPIPKELGNLQAVSWLSLSSNQLSGPIPKELGNLQAVTTLNLWSNQLSGMVPAELSNLADSVRLDLSSNKLTSLGGVDDAFKLVQKFKGRQRNRPWERLHLEENPWVMPPEALVEEGLSAVETYLEDVLTATNAGVGIKTMQLLKVVLVGSSQAGKTSLMDSIVHGEAKPTEGTPEEVSTIGIQLRRHPLKGVRVEFYDCAGQLDYAGMHQVFLSRRALYLLVWDVKKCQGKAGSTLDKVIKDDVMPWLYALHLRAPDSTVILVANKCDGSIDSFSKTVQTVRTRVNELLSTWNYSRGFSFQKASRLSTLNVLADTSKVSCRDGIGLAELVDVITAESCTSISVPPSWDLALVVIDALRDKKEPLMVAREHLNLSSSPPPDREDRPSDLYIPKEDLTRQWNGVLRALTESGELPSATGKAVVLNPDSALEGSLGISEYAGQLLRVDGGDGIFLDVGMLSEVLNPVVDHKLPKRIFTTSLLNAWKDRLLRSGVLSPEFARHLWGNLSRKHAPQTSTETFESALFNMLIKLGVAFPLGRVPSRQANDGNVTITGGQQDMLVWRWLPERLGELGETAFKALVDQLEDGAREVTLNWEFDSAGAPQGLMERLIALCHVIGEAEEALCWRSGAVFRSPRLSGGTDPLYVAEIRYSSTERVLSVNMSGNLRSSRVWAALRFVASVMVNVSKEWPGALWAGWVQCADHPLQRLRLATPTEARLGAPLIPLTSVGCACQREGGTVLGQAVARLGDVIDTTTGDPFLLCDDLDADGQRGEPPGNGCCEYAFSMCRQSAWKTSTACMTTAFGLFITVLVEDLSAPRTYAVVAVIVVLVAAAGAAACVAFRQDLAEQQQQHPDGEQVALIA